MKKLLLPLLAAVAMMTVTSACTRAPGGPVYSATGFASIAPDLPFEDGKLVAIRAAERSARDQILLQTLSLISRTGESLEELVISDPFVRAKVYDTIRTAKITDKTIDDENSTVTVTVELDQAPLQEFISSYNSSS